jgi:hypothetical protein
MPRPPATALKSLGARRTEHPAAARRNVDDELDGGPI